jgi:hypothetical protein
MIAIRVEQKYKSISKSLFGWGNKGESNAPITAKREVAGFFEAVEAGLAIRLNHDSYWGRARI